MTHAHSDQHHEGKLNAWKRDPQMGSWGMMVGDVAQWGWSVRESEVHWWDRRVLPASWLCPVTGVLRRDSHSGIPVTGGNWKKGRETPITFKYYLKSFLSRILTFRSGKVGTSSGESLRWQKSVPDCLFILKLKTTLLAGGFSWADLSIVMPLGFFLIGINSTLSRFRDGHWPPHLEQNWVWRAYQ